MKLIPVYYDNGPVVVVHVPLLDYVEQVEDRGHAGATVRPVGTPDHLDPQLVVVVHRLHGEFIAGAYRLLRLIRELDFEVLVLQLLSARRPELNKWLKIWIQLIQ
jgi:hypothetical protein